MTGAGAPSYRASLGAAVALLVVHIGSLCIGSGPASTVPLSPALAKLRLDPNRASAAELELLPRIGPRIAAEIIAYRESVSDPPAFRTAADLDRVKRIGPATVDQMRPFLKFPNEPAERPRASAAP